MSAVKVGLPCALCRIVVAITHSVGFGFIPLENATACLPDHLVEEETKAKRPQLTFQVIKMSKRQHRLSDYKYSIFFLYHRGKQTSINS